MKIALLDIQTKDKATNKTMAGGYGTISRYNSSQNASFLVRILEILKKVSVRVPLIEFAYLDRIFRQAGHEVKVHYADDFPEAGLYLIYVSLVEYQNELLTAKKIKQKYPNARIGFIGTVATVMPEVLLPHADFVIKGESEGFFLQFQGDYRALKGIIDASFVEDLERLPFPEWADYDMKKFIHFPFFGNLPVYPVLGSRGCPFTCRYYCAYPIVAGLKVRYRKVEKIVEELVYLVEKYGAKAILFRDPNFSLDLNRAKELCRQIIAKRLNIRWACETHLNCVDRELVDLMHASGGRAITVGIESRNKEVLIDSKRQDVDERKLRDIIDYCERKRIKIMAGYIFGNLKDTRDSILHAINYAKELNTSFAQFYISTPYPGTEYYKELRPKIKTDDWEKYDTYSLVFEHPNVSAKEMEELKQKAYIIYYFRPRWIWKFLKEMAYDLLDRV